MCGGDAAICQLTLTSCWFLLSLNKQMLMMMMMMMMMVMFAEVSEQASICDVRETECFGC